MQTGDLIAADEFSVRYNIETSFIYSLQEAGLIEMVTIQETPFIPLNQLTLAEKWVRLHYDMDINLEGIETIAHLLDRIENMRNEITDLKNRLRFYEQRD